MGRPKGLKTDSSADLFYLWMVAFAFAAVAFGAVINSARAQVPDSEVACYTPEFIKKTTKARFIAPIVVVQEGELAQAFIARLNAAGKPTSYIGDYVLFWMIPNRPPFQVMIFNKGCATVQCIYGKGCLPIQPIKKAKGIKV